MCVCVCNCEVIFLKNYLLICFWLCCIFIAALELSLGAVSWGHSSLWCTGFFSLRYLLLLWSMNSGAHGHVVQEVNCPEACGIFLDQGSNLCPPESAGGFLSTVLQGKS